MKFGTTPCSALDFHVLFDTSGADLQPIRNRLKIDLPVAPGNEGSNRRERLYMRPYVVTPLAGLTRADAAALEWAKRRHYDDPEVRSLRGAVRAILTKPKESEREDTAHLPRSQGHALHEALYLGRAVANGRLRQIEHRYPDFPWQLVCEGGNGSRSLFVDDGKETVDGQEYECVGAYLLDAMELADLEGEDAI